LAKILRTEYKIKRHGFAAGLGEGDLSPALILEDLHLLLLEIA